MAAKQATPTIPIVIAPASSDAVATGLIASLARPGGNVTGLTDELGQLSTKRMELLKETVPKAARIAVLWNANDPGMNLRYRAIESAARVLNVEVESLGLYGPDDFDVAFATMLQRTGPRVSSDGPNTNFGIGRGRCRQARSAGRTSVVKRSSWASWSSPMKRMQRSVTPAAA